MIGTYTLGVQSQCFCNSQCFLTANLTCMCRKDSAQRCALPSAHTDCSSSSSRAAARLPLFPELWDVQALH